MITGDETLLQRLERRPAIACREIGLVRPGFGIGHAEIRSGSIEDRLNSRRCYFGQLFERLIPS